MFRPRALRAAACAALTLAATLAAAPAQAVSLPGETQIPQAASTPQQRVAAFTVSVVRGDTLWALAGRWCANPYRYPALAAASGIRNPDRIQIGQRITISCSPSLAPSPIKSPPAQTADWAAPVTGSYCTGWFGQWRGGSTLNGVWIGPHRHAGIDLPRRYGTPIRAMTTGTVRRAGWIGGLGLAVEVAHGSNGYTSMYGHQSRLVVHAGQRVHAGQLLGYVGSTGHASGPHVHFELRHYGTPYDPQPTLRRHGIIYRCGG